MLSFTLSSEASMPVEATQLVDDVMRRWPATIRVFLKYRMHCVGCPITCFHTVSDACREHNVDQAEFLDELNASVEQGPAVDVAECAVTTARWPS